MSKQYVTVLEESLEKKLRVLEEIYRICVLQAETIAEEPINYDVFDCYMEDKDVCIEKLNKLDEGFDLIYNRVGDELKQNKFMYEGQIRHMQELISAIMDKSTAIQAQEERNKKAIEAIFVRERQEIGKGKRSLNVAMNYYRNMNGANAVPPQYMDKKK